MIIPSWRRFLTRKSSFEGNTSKWGFVMGIESGRSKIIKYDFVEGQGNPPSYQRFATSTTRQTLSWTANLWQLGGFPFPCTKSWKIRIVSLQTSCLMVVFNGIALSSISCVCWIKIKYQKGILDHWGERCNNIFDLLFWERGWLNWSCHTTIWKWFLYKMLWRK